MTEPTVPRGVGEAGTSRGRRPRRAVRPGTKPSADDVPDLAPERPRPDAEETESDRWLREQRPPHWE